jgi:hypothetical protein
MLYRTVEAGIDAPDPEEISEAWMRHPRLSATRKQNGDARIWESPFYLPVAARLSSAA